MTDTKLPPDLTVKRLTVDSAAGPLEWWRVERADGSIVGSGFDREEAIAQARRELERRGAIGLEV